MYAVASVVACIACDGVAGAAVNMYAVASVVACIACDANFGTGNIYPPVVIRCICNFVSIKAQVANSTITSRYIHNAFLRARIPHTF